ncbi:MAG: hypothetical protein SWE60_16855 [Thermodesulfobacteriota bacterium]|nr:hypothetical protein [Thermodesulfobacteriota bacterium]
MKGPSRERFFRVWAVLFAFAGLLCLFPSRALSGVVVHDVVAVKDQKIMLRAETRGKLFRRGGELVEFFVDGKSIGKNLSGGDGIAFKPFVPKSTGIFQLQVRSRGEEGTGRLLSLDRGSAIVLVDVEGTLFEGPFPMKARLGSQEVIERTCERFPVVFLQTSLVGLRVVKGWLKENEYVASPVVAWGQGAVLEEMAEKGLHIKAVIAGPKVIETWKGKKPLTFSFDRVEGAERVKEWEEIGSKLLAEKN